MPFLPLRIPDDPRLDPYRALKTTNLTRWSGLFIAEGRRVVERLVASRFPIESILVSERLVDDLRPILSGDIPVYVLPQPLAEQLVGYNFHAGILACGRRLPAPCLDEILRDAPRRCSLVVCPHTTDPDNLGTIIRLCTAFGVSALILGHGCADPFSRRTLRVSMGNAFQLPILECPDLPHQLSRLRHEHDITLFATVTGTDAEPLPGVAVPARSAILFGNEADGLDPCWQQLCDRRITIPMHPGTDSLNVATAAAILLYHFRQSLD